MKIPALPKLSKRTWALIAAGLVILAAIPGLGVVGLPPAIPFCLSCRRIRSYRCGSPPGPSGIGGLRECHTSSHSWPIEFSASDDVMNQ
jgi:hypothetical protein